jgi:hypothetical protein
MQQNHEIGAQVSPDNAWKSLAFSSEESSDGTENRAMRLWTDNRFPSSNSAILVCNGIELLYRILILFLWGSLI